ncbi:MAG: hypothetical protein E4H40_06260 [Candidatus Brocadiia bacterium]|nr:MAG: hypothetical protein E4H40_06260 [Candidatus Brocadiia bacterium]
MSELDVVKNLAKRALLVNTLTGSDDAFLWDRSQRLVRNVEHICQLPEVQGTGTQPNQFCLIIAAYFCDAGLARYLGRAGSGSIFVNGNRNGESLLESSAAIVDQFLSGIIDKEKIDNVSKIIIDSGNRFTQRAEAMILSDARNLDDMGAVGIFTEFRYYAIQGKSVSDALKSWDRKIDYRYWQARLKEGFRFDSVRELAKQRLSAAKSFMDQLKAESEFNSPEEISQKKGA